MIRQHFEPEASEFLSDLSRAKGFDIRSDQIESGRFEGFIDFAGTANAQFFRDRFARLTCNHGAVPAGMAAFTLPATPAESAVFCGEEVTPRTLCVITPGDEYSYLAPANHAFLGSCLAQERLDRALRSLHHIALDRVLPRTANVLIPPGAMATLRVAHHAAFRVPSHPDHLLDLDGVDQDVEDALIAVVCTALTADLAPAPTRLASRNHWRCVRLVRHYVEAHLGEDLRIETLCRTCGVSARTLETAFREVTDCSPRQFIRVRRLNAAREALARGRREETSVKAVALSCGFWHLGRFAHDYRALFGETPSASLRRSSPRRH